MAKKGSITIQGGITVPNAYLRLGGISGGKQSGYWQADVQVFSDGGVAALAYEAACATDPNADRSAMEAVRVQAGLPLVSSAWQADSSPYTLLYAALSVLYPSLSNV